MRFLAQILLACAIGCVAAATAQAQLSCGDRPCPRITVTMPKPNPSRPRQPRGPRPSPRGTPATPQPAEPEEPAPPCKSSDLVVVCGMPGCQITLNNKDKYITDAAGGYVFQIDGNQTVNVKVTKAGYKGVEATRKLDCGDAQDVPAFLGANQVTLRIRTVPAECDIYIDNQKQPKGSDAQGLFSYLLTKPNLLIEAKKPKYLPKSRSIQLRPELADGEIVLELEPLPATLKLSTSVPDAQITIDSQGPQSANATISLSPGTHSSSITALGYTPASLNFSLAPDETISREVKLDRLSLADLQSEAEKLLTTRAYDDVLKLSGYMLEIDHANGAAHRLAGFVYLARGDFANAGGQFDQALAGNEPIPLRIRRHPGEKFDLTKGHNVCEAQVILRKSEIEFHGLRNASEDFRVAYDQMQLGAIQLKNSVAVYLATKVIVNGKRHDYNFYNFDKELSQTGKPYLEMVQRLLRPH